MGSLLNNLALFFILAAACPLRANLVESSPIKLSFGVEDDDFYRNSPSYAQLKSYFKAAMKTENIEVEYVEIPSLRMGVAVNEGSLDGDFLSGESKMPTYTNASRLKYAWYKFRVSSFTYGKSAEMKPHDLKNRSVCGPMWLDSELKQRVPELKIDFISVNNNTSCFEMVRSQRAAYGLISTLVLRDLQVKKSDELKGLSFSNQPVIEYGMTALISKKNSKHLLSIEKALKNFAKNKDQYPLIKDRL